jgi:hypothetical protein
MNKKYIAVATKVGYAVQNTSTYHIVGVYTEQKAKEICDNLNKPKVVINNTKVYEIKESDINLRKANSK